MFFKNLIIIILISFILQIESDDNFTISLNLTKYLELLTQNESVIENKTIINSTSDLKDKKLGLVKGSFYEIFARRQNLLNNISYVIYDTYDEAQAGLGNYSIDYIICSKEIIGDLIQMYTENLTYIEVNNATNYYDFGIVMKKENTALNKAFSSLFNVLRGVESNNNSLINDSTTDLNEYYFFMDRVYNDWIGVDEGLKVLPNFPKSSNTTYKCLVNFNQPPLAYKENNEQKGIIPLFAIFNAYLANVNFDLIETTTDEFYIPEVKNGTVDSAFGYIYKGELDDNVSFVQSPFNLTPIAIIRYDNSENSKKWLIPNSVQDFNGEKLGSLNNQKDLLKQLFPKTEDSQIQTARDQNKLFNLLLKEQVEGILIDKIMLDYFKNHSKRISSYDDILVNNNSYGILFNNKTIRDEFNDFLNTNYTDEKLKELFEEWRKADSNKTISTNFTNLTGNAGSFDINVTNVRPMSYEENNQYKGYEIDLLYRFAKAKGYTLTILNWAIPYTNSTFHTYVGCKNITEDSEDNYYSKPILNSTSILSVRQDSIRKTLPLVVLDENYKEKDGNKIDFQTNINGVPKNVTCIVPSTFYNDVINLNCNSSDLSQSPIELSSINSKDKIQILYSNIRVDNLINSNNLFPGNNLIYISNWTGNNSINITDTIIESESGTETDSDIESDIGNNTNTGNQTINQYIRYKSSSGLSTGGIIGIVIPCCLVLIGITAASLFLCKNSNVTAPVQYSNMPQNYFVTNNNYAINDYSNKDFAVNNFNKNLELNKVSPVNANI